MSDSVVCDLVLLSWNHLEETLPCLESLFQYTDVPSRLLIVDNGSEPPVRAALGAVQPRGMIQDVVLLQNETNEGFPKGMNRGLRASSAPYACLLNNDLRVGPGWLSRLVEVAQAHSDIGVVNPASNPFGEYPPRGSSIEAYAASLERKRGIYVEVGMCIGFCMLITRQVLDRIGQLTEEVERIFFEDEDYCMRAQLAGFRCVVAHASYVYHAEHQTVKRMGERERLFRRNQQWCEARWGRRLRIAYPRFTEILPGTPDLRTWLERLVSWARQRAHIYVYCPTPREVSPEMLFRSVGLVPHSDVHWHSLPRSLARLAAVGAILQRQKKRFDAIVAPDPRWAGTMRRLRWIHRATVIPLSDTTALATLWQNRSLSQLSS